MKIINLIFLSFSISFLISCEKKCELKPIPNNIFDLDKLRKTVIVKCGKETDSLVLTEKIDEYVESSYRGPMKNVECQHYKSYEFSFREDQIGVSVIKKDNDTLELNVVAFGRCTNLKDERIISEKELLLNKEYVFEREKDCDSNNSVLKKVVLKGGLIVSFTTSDNKTWIPK